MYSRYYGGRFLQKSMHLTNLDFFLLCVCGGGAVKDRRRKIEHQWCCEESVQTRGGWWM